MGTRYFESQISSMSRGRCGNRGKSSRYFQCSDGSSNNFDSRVSDSYENSNRSSPYYRRPRSDARGNYQGRNDDHGNKVNRKPSHYHGKEESSNNFTQYEGSESSQYNQREYNGLDEDKKQYFQMILENLSTSFDDKEEEEMFLLNALRETKGEELFLSTTALGSQCIEQLLHRCPDPDTICQFLTAFSEDLDTACFNRSSAHVMEALLASCLWMIQHKANVEGDKADQRICPEEWLVTFSQDCIGNFENMLEEPSSDHILRSLFEVLGGSSIDASFAGINSKKIHVHKQSKIVPYKYEVSKPLKNALLDFVKKIKEYLIEGSIQKISLLVQHLLLVLQSSFPKDCQKLISFLFEKCFENMDIEKLGPSDNSFLYLTERIIELSDNETRKLFWDKTLTHSFQTLALSPGSNFLVASWIKSVKSDKELMEMFDFLHPILNDIFQAGNYKIILNFAEKCRTLGVCQAQFVQSLISIFNCGESKKKEELLLVALLKWKPLAPEDDLNSFNGSFVSLQGSLVLQQLLFFFKPHKILSCIKAFSTHQLCSLACSQSGSHVIEAFFQSTYIGEKSHLVIIQQMKNEIANLACDKFGSRVLDSLWKKGSLKLKIFVAEGLGQQISRLQSDKYGSFIARNYQLKAFLKSKEEWTQALLIQTKKKEAIHSIISV